MPRPSTADPAQFHSTTGPIEEVTPWELYPVPLFPAPSSSSSYSNPEQSHHPTRSNSASLTSMSISHQTRASMTLQQLEEVMPWELHPGPVPANDKERRRMTTHQAQLSRATTPASAFSDFGLKRRRSTGAGGVPSKARSEKEKEKEKEGKGKEKERDHGRDKHRLSSSIQGIASSISLPPPPPPPLVSRHSEGRPTIASSGSTRTSRSNSVLTAPPLPIPIPPSTATATSTPSPSPGTGTNPASASTSTPAPNTPNTAPKFSTADRTILEQLKASLQAREAQFVVKGVGHTVVGGGYSPGKKHHAYKKGEVPYPRSYGREVVDLDVWETMFTFDMCESLTWHVFQTPPTKVLDIGCGTGTWTLHCARTWKDCHFVGLDIVPLHPDLQNVGSPDLAARITWVQHNFLDGMPFQNEEFDFVRIKRIALGVPEDKWDRLFEEIARVMKPGGAFEMIEEDLFFPGKQADDSEEALVFTQDDSSSFTPRNSFNVQDEASTLPQGHKELPAIPMDNTPSGRAASRPASPTRAREYARNSDSSYVEQLPFLKTESTPAASSSADPAPSSVTVLVTPHSRSAARPQLLVKTQPPPKPPSDPYAELARAHPAVFAANLSMVGGGMGYLASQDSLMNLVKQRKRERAGAEPPPLPRKLRAPGLQGKSQVSPFLLRSLTVKAPTNPRDHTILEAVWNGMLEDRFVNRTPLSILTTFLEYHFKDVRTHPPLMYTFPPLPVKPEEDDSDTDDVPLDTHQPYDSGTDTDDARDAVVPMPKRPRSTKSRKSATSAVSATFSPISDENGELAEEHRWLSMKSLLQHSSPYVILDESRGFSYSPTVKATFQAKAMSKDGRPPVTRRKSSLPNTTLNFDLRSLNLHLALRAKEIIACSESMWEWVQELQTTVTGDSVSGGRYRSGSIEGYMVGVQGAGNTSLDPSQNAILEMTRDDFDHLLNNFEMDMQDKASVGNALQERFSWHVFPSPILQDRKAFDLACEKYDNWLVSERKPKLPTDPYPQSTHDRSRNSMSSPGLVLSPNLSATHESNIISRSSSSPQPATSERLSVSDDTSSITTLAATSANRNDNHAPLVSPSLSHISTHAVTQMLSRATRVFVAWKAS